MADGPRCADRIGTRRDARRRAEDLPASPRLFGGTQRLEEPARYIFDNYHTGPKKARISRTSRRALPVALFDTGKRIPQLVSVSAESAHAETCERMSAGHAARGLQSGKLSAIERSALNQALAKALPFRDAGKMPEARDGPANWFGCSSRMTFCRDAFAALRAPPTAETGTVALKMVRVIEGGE